MSQVITTPDGVEHEFPDNTSDDVIKNTLSSYSKPQTPQTPQGYQSPSWLPGAGWLHKMSNIFDDSATLGGADPATATVGNLLRGAGVANATPDTATLRAQTAQNRADVGPIASGAADLAGYAVGPGSLEAGGKLAGRLGGGLLARMGGSAAENALAASGGTIGHGGSLQDAGKAATVGGLIGAITGALPGGRGPAPTTPSTADLQAASQQAFAPLKGQTQNASRIANAIDNVTAGMDVGDAVSMGPKIAEMRDFISKTLNNGGTVTSDSIAKIQRELKAAAGGSETRQAIVKQYTDALNNAVGPSAAYDIGAANRASNIAQTSGEIGDWAANPSKAPAAVKSALENNPNFYKTQPGMFDALDKIGKKADDPSFMRQVINHVAGSVVGAGIGGVGDYIAGDHTPFGLLTGAVTGAAMPRIKGVIRTGPVKGGLLAAQHLNATGIPVDPGVFTNPWLQRAGELARQGGYAAGASGGL